jgi:hypothetical protein
MLLQALQAEPRFDAPKAQLARIVIRGLLDELLSRGPAQATLVILSLLAFFQGVPLVAAVARPMGGGATRSERRLRDAPARAAVAARYVRYLTKYASPNAKNAIQIRITKTGRRWPS